MDSAAVLFHFRSSCLIDYTLSVGNTSTTFPEAVRPRWGCTSTVSPVPTVPPRTRLPSQPAATASTAKPTTLPMTMPAICPPDSPATLKQITCGSVGRVKGFMSSIAKSIDLRLAALATRLGSLMGRISFFTGTELRLLTFLIHHSTPFCFNSLMLGPPTT